MIRGMNRQLTPVLVAVAVAFALSALDGPLGWSEATTRFVLAGLVIALAPLGTLYALSGRAEAPRDAGAGLPRRRTR